MASRDIFHEDVKKSLVADGWKITHDPYSLKHYGLRMEVDLGAEKVIAAEKESHKIAVEVKSFLSKSLLYDFHEALGQFRTYRRIIGKNEPDRILFLAVTEDVFEGFFAEPFGAEAIEEENLNVLVFNPLSKRIVKWIKKEDTNKS